MTSSTPVTVVPRGMVAGGDAVAALPDGRVVFVTGALPDESVVIDVVDERRDFARAVVREVLVASPDRVAEPCAARREGCGGCDWMHVSDEGQRRWKTAIVVDALRRTARLPDAPVRWGGSVPPFGYRTSMRFVGDAAGRPGLRAAGSHRVVPIAQCHVAAPPLEALLVATHGVPGRESALRVALASGERSVVVVNSRARSPRPPGGAGATVVETVHDKPLRISATSFFQSGPAAAELLVDTVRAQLVAGAADRRGVLVDAYGGVGLFGATLGWPRVVVVESNAAACRDARANLSAVADAVVVCTPFERWDASTVVGEVATVVADPARAGLGRGGVATIAATGAAVVVLVSCDVASMARDTALLAAVGYRHVESVVLDLFPQTHHVEVVTLFIR